MATKQHLRKTEKTDPRGRPIYAIGGVEMSEAKCKDLGIISRDSGGREITVAEILNQNKGRRMRGQGVPA